MPPSMSMIDRPAPDSTVIIDPGQKIQQFLMLKTIN